MSTVDDVISLRDLLRCLAECSERAARIARTFREQEELFDLLVEEKSEIRKDRTQVRDFKTLADVLVQETIKRDVGRQFPSLTRIQGEEQNSFRNTLGECIRVELTDSPDETAGLLSRVLDGRMQTARRLADAVHSTVQEIVCDFDSPLTVAADSLAIWIDPIDSTAEYIQAKERKSGGNDDDRSPGMEVCGLHCVCVLIGAYDVHTGLPLLGIVNQPFFQRSGSLQEWEGRLYWGVHCNSVARTSLETEGERRKEEAERRVVVTSSFEKPQLQSLLGSRYHVVHAAGAGYKCLVVTMATADLYVLSLPNTHLWDTCGPHAILSARGGGIVDFDRALRSTVDAANVSDYQLRYSSGSDPEFRNTGGIVAYRRVADLLELLEFLRESDYGRGPDQ